jgi:hypothetical protein
MKIWVWALARLNVFLETARVVVVMWAPTAVKIAIDTDKHFKELRGIGRRGLLLMYLLLVGFLRDSDIEAT